MEQVLAALLKALIAVLAECVVYVAKKSIDAEWKMMNV